MPVIKSAKKKLRQDKQRTAQNQKVRRLLNDFVKKAKKKPSQKSVKEAFAMADKAAKHHIIHKNKAAHIKSTLSKLLNAKQPKKSQAKVKK